jgi:sugar O-acyltransferase (sialic acid O-acetyltransferase NeuD family)
MSSPPPVVFFGSSGHARSFSESVRARAPEPLAEVVAYIDDFRGDRGESIDGAPIVSFDTWRASLIETSVFVAVGQSRPRHAIVERVRDAGGRFVALYRLGGPIARNVTVGEGTLVFELVSIGSGTTIGRHVQIMPLASIDADCTIGDFTTICPSATIYGRVLVEEGAFIGVGARIVNEAEEPLTIGAWSTIGAGAVVTAPVRAGQKLSGNPAQELRSLAASRRT